MGNYGQIWLKMAVFGGLIRVQLTPWDERYIVQPCSTSIQPISVSSGLLRLFNLVYAGFRWFLGLFGPFWASLAKIRGTPKMKNGALNILICLLDPIKSLGTAGWWKKEFLKTPLHHCSITRSAQVNKAWSEKFPQLRSHLPVLPNILRVSFKQNILILNLSI